MTWVLFEISFPISFLVSMVVSFVLIPTAKKSKMPVDGFFKLYPLEMDNCNIIYMTGEFIANQLPFVLTHMTLMLLYAYSYVIFSWIWHYSRGYYYYFILDYHRPGALFWYVGLLSGVSVLFCAGYACSYLQSTGNHIAANLVSTLLQI